MEEEHFGEFLWKQMEKVFIIIIINLYKVKTKPPKPKPLLHLVTEV